MYSKYLSTVKTSDFGLICVKFASIINEQLFVYVNLPRNAETAK